MLSLISALYLNQRGVRNMKTARELVSQAKNEVRLMVENCETESHVVIARYTAAARGNFISWIGQTIPWARHENARQILIENLRVEQVEDHYDMLGRFAERSNAMPGKEHFEFIKNELDAVFRLFADPVLSGLRGIVVLAIVENGSGIFMENLAPRGEECGCTDFTYTIVHSEVDPVHAEAAIRGIEAEMTMGYQDPIAIIEETIEVVAKLIAKVFA
jgi:hypothetical protein